MTDTYQNRMTAAVADVLEQCDPLSPDDLSTIVNRIMEVRDEQVAELQAKADGMHPLTLEIVAASLRNLTQDAYDDGDMFEAGYARLMAYATELAEQQPKPLHEWRCPACGATTRALMSDQD